MFFDQTFGMNDLAIVGLLVVLEGVLSIDNALVLGLLAKRLPKHLQKKALTYGLVGAFIFRLIAIATAAYLLKWRFVKLLGGGYLIYVAANHFFHEWRGKQSRKIAVGPEGEPVMVDEKTGAALKNGEIEEEVMELGGVPGPGIKKGMRTAAFWPTVGVIELTDIAFAVDSILAAIALVGSAPAGYAGRFHPKLWVVVTGGMLGVILMRFAAIVFIKLLEKFPRFEVSAYLLVLVIGGKLLLDWGFNTDPHNPVLNFHGLTMASLVFWGLMVACFAVGFIPKKKD